MVYFIYTECRLQNIELKLDELKTIETSILTQDTRRHSLPGKIRLEKRFYVVYLREIYSILTEDTGRHSLPGKIRLGRDFTWYFREIYSLMTQDTRKQTLTIPGKIRLVRDFTLYRRQFSPTKIKWNGDLALIKKANYFKKFTLSHWTGHLMMGGGREEFPLYMEEICLPSWRDK